MAKQIKTLHYSLGLTSHGQECPQNGAHGSGSAS